MDSCRYRIFSLITVAILLGGFIPGAVSANEPVGGESATVEISDSIVSTAGEQTVVIRLTDQPSTAIHTTAATGQPTAMKIHAADTQEPFMQFASSNPHVKIDSRLWLTNALVVTVDTDEIPLEQLADIEYAERIHENYAVTTANVTTAKPSPQFSQTTVKESSTTSAAEVTSSAGDPTVTQAIKHIGVPSAWNKYNTRGEGVKIAVVDTGVNPDHPDIKIDDENWVCYVDCSNNPDGPHDANGHGTHVSGTVVGGNNNDAGIHIGVAPEATLMHAKGMGDNGQGTFNSLIKSMQWAIDNDAHILSMSLGTSGINDALIDPVRNAQNSGVVVIGAVGNSGVDTSSSPANVYGATAVGSVDVEPTFPAGVSFVGIDDDTVSEFSGGEMVSADEWYDHPPEWPDTYTVPDVTAPGAVIWSADTNSATMTCGNISTKDLTCLQGSSMATPHVAGTAALMLSANKTGLSPSDIRSVLRSTAVDIGAPETRQGAGRINATAAVGAVADDDTLVDVDPSNLQGTGTTTDPYIINNVSGLQAIGDDPSANYTLGSDIDASTAIGLNNGTGFHSIGRTQSYQGDEPASFTGSFDGNGHAITNIQIGPQEQRNTALFSWIGATGTVGNVTISNIKINGDTNAAGAAGINHGKVVNTSVTGTVNGTSNLGGLVGNNTGTVHNSSVNITVSGTGELTTFP